MTHNDALIKIARMTRASEITDWIAGRRWLGRPWQPGEVVALQERARMLGLTEKQWQEAMR